MNDDKNAKDQGHYTISGKRGFGQTKDREM